MSNLRNAVVVGVMVFLFGVGSLGQIAWGDITGSAHDFSSQAWSGGQACIVCHAPHNSQGTLVPLWNRATTSKTFTLYSSPTLGAQTAQPSGASKACLSCHDGTVALDSFGGRTGTTFIQGAGRLDSDLSNDHPVSILYDTALAVADGGLKDPATTPSGLAGANATIRSSMLFNDRLECASCHDVHNTYNQDWMLIKSNAQSALCLTCHKK